MDTRAAQRARWRAAIDKDEERDALIADLLAVAKREAKDDSRANLAVAECWRFRGLIEDALEQLRGAPLSSPLPLEAWRLAARPRQHRAALLVLAKRVKRLARWDLALARAIEQEEPAALALWLAPPVKRGPARVEMPQIVRDGKLPTQHATAKMLRDWAKRIPNRGGKGHELGDGFDAAALLLARAYAAIAGRTGDDVMAVSLSNSSVGLQNDTGPVARFIDSVIRRATPQHLVELGPQAINGAMRRCRALLGGKTTRRRAVKCKNG